MRECGTTYFSIWLGEVDRGGIENREEFGDIPAMFVIVGSPYPLAFDGESWVYTDGQEGLTKFVCCVEVEFEGVDPVPSSGGLFVVPRMADKIEYSRFAASEPNELLKVLKFGERL